MLPDTFERRMNSIPGEGSKGVESRMRGRPSRPVRWGEEGCPFEAAPLLPNGFWSLLRSWLRPHRGISQDKLPDYLGLFQFVHNARRRGKALLGALVAALVA